MTSKNRKLFQLVLSALFLALALVLPFLTGQIPGMILQILLIPVPVMVVKHAYPKLRKG